MLILFAINISSSFKGYFTLRDVAIKNVWSVCSFICFEGGDIFVPLKSELDELQEEVARRAHEQELRRKREKEMEAAMGFNPRPSRFMDLDELQNQGKLSMKYILQDGSAEVFLKFPVLIVCVCLLPHPPLITILYLQIVKYCPLQTRKKFKNCLVFCPNFFLNEKTK